MEAAELMNHFHQEAISRIDRMIMWIRSEAIRHELELIKNNIVLGSMKDERDIEAALNGALRGSEFPGDMVGRPRDDFDE
jgi:hypothetical protein